MRREIRLSGFGGQGIGLAGYILGKAFALYDGYDAVMTQAYGPEARGGSSSADIVISDEHIDFPFVLQPDILVALSQEAYKKFRGGTKCDAMVIIDGDLVAPDESDIVFSIPATRLAEEMGKRIIANVVMVGFFTAITELVSQEAVEQAIKSSVKPNTIDLNLDAFRVGADHIDAKQLTGIG